MKKNDTPRSPLFNALRTGLIIVALFLLYAYATEFTEVNLEKPLEERRQTAVLRALRGLARPDFFDYNEETRTIDIAIRMPCPDNVQGSIVGKGTREVTLTPFCADTTQDVLTVEGTGFRPNTDGLLRWHPPSDVEGSTRALERFRSDNDGNFTIEFTMPDIRPTDDPQLIEVEEKWPTSIAGLSEASQTTLNAITETILMALMATTIGTILSIPVSFLAARNLMSPIGLPLAAVMAGIIGLPVGYFLFSRLTSLLFGWTDQMGVNLALEPSGGEIGMSAGLAAVALVAMVGVMRAGGGMISAEKPQSSPLVTILRTLAIVLLLIFALGHLADLGSVIGRALEERLGWFDFVGGFIAIIFEFIDLIGPTIIGFLGALVIMSLASGYAEETLLRSSPSLGRSMTVVLSALGAAALVYGIGTTLNGLYDFDFPLRWTLYPAIVFAILGAIGGFIIAPKRAVPIGLVVYTIIRSVLNIIRAIEPLVYVIIFAVWVGIGPFAGILALTLHTIAALGKLFSEQVENIADGPIEAITATGANRIQTIVFGVIPQIVPPYIAFTLYRWDINVRMSTIIGMGGGGGIGFVLLQAINLLRYRQAAVMMIAIAVVVMTLDYISSKVRQRIL